MACGARGTVSFPGHSKCFSARGTMCYLSLNDGIVLDHKVTCAGESKESSSSSAIFLANTEISAMLGKMRKILSEVF